MIRFLGDLAEGATPLSAKSPHPRIMSLKQNLRDHYNGQPVPAILCISTSNLISKPGTTKILTGKKHNEMAQKWPDNPPITGLLVAD